MSLRLLGGYAEATALDEETWRRSARLHGEDDDRALDTIAGLTVNRHELGDCLGARAAQESTDAPHRQIFPNAPDRPAQVRSARHLAVALRRAGAHREALGISREAGHRLYARHGGEDAATLMAAVAYSLDLRSAGEARRVSERTRARYAAKLGATHSHTLAAEVNLAVVERLSGKLEGPSTSATRKPSRRSSGSWVPSIAAARRTWGATCTR